MIGRVDDPPPMAKFAGPASDKTAAIFTSAAARMSAFMVRFSVITGQFLTRANGAQGVKLYFGPQYPNEGIGMAGVIDVLELVTPF